MLHVESHALKGNLLGDPTRREVLVYEPGDLPSAALPWVMVLGGFGSTPRSMVACDPFRPNLVERLDHIMRTSVCKPALVVLPDAVSSLGGSQFLDSPVHGHHQRFLADEVPALLTQHFHVATGPERHAVVGRSSGGFGALRLVLDRPDAFSVVGAHAADGAFKETMPPILQHAAIHIQRMGGLEAYVPQVLSRGFEGADYGAMFAVACGAAFSPNVRGALPYAHMPYDAETLKRNEEIWRLWLGADPVHTVENCCPHALQGVRFAWIDAGYHDEYGLQFASRQLANAFESKGVALHHEEFPGGHRGTSWRYEHTLPPLIETLWQ